MLPVCNMHGILLHFSEISHKDAHGAHTVLIMDMTTCHSSQKLDVTKDITIL